MRVISNVICLLLISSINSEQPREFVVKILGGPNVAQLLAEETWSNFKGQVKGFPDTYIFIPRQNVYPNFDKRGMHVNKKFSQDPRVLWADEQHSKDRVKRDFIDPSDIPHDRVKRIEDPEPKYHDDEEIIKSNQEKIHKSVNDSLNKSDHQEVRSKLKRTKRWIRFPKIKMLPVLDRVDRTFNDELWNQEWYLKETGTENDLPKLDLNVLPLYRLGITGKGVRISILDDGIEYTHDDLKNNYDPEISYDCNEDDDDPLPRYDPLKSNNHGTRCAGEIAMTADNGKCGVGIAFNAKIGGIKVLDGMVTDRLEGTALSFGVDLIDIYSASWGPTDDGKTVDGPGRLASEAIEKGIREGRKGKGSIYVWASGNGGNNGDNCDCDGYLNSVYTISIGSASQKGEFPWYGEACASTLAVTYSSGANKDLMIATTDLNNNCTIKHTGTSASAPLAAGIIALALEVNPELTWRDVQHLIVFTSELTPLINNPGWQRNAAGLWFNTKFGFGLMNAFELVKQASNWTRVPDKSICKVNIVRGVNVSLAYDQPVVVPFTTEACKSQPNEVNYLEHVEVLVNIDYSNRGALEIYLISPAGTKVQILSRRKKDNSVNGFHNWKFLSVMTWGESPHGIWKLAILDKVGPYQHRGFVGDCSLYLHGTKKKSNHLKIGSGEFEE